MKKTIATSAFGTVPVVAFHRLHVETNEPISFHSIVFQCVGDAKEKANWIERQPHLALVGITDATFDDQRQSARGETAVPTTRTEYGKRLDSLHARIAARLGEKPVVYYSAYQSDDDDLPIDNLDEVAIHGKVRFLAEHVSEVGEGRPYSSEIVESPTWLDVAVLANEMIKTTCDFHHQFLESVRIAGEDNGTKLAKFSMGS